MCPTKFFCFTKLTKRLKHFVTFIKDEELEVLEVQDLVVYQLQNTTRSTNHNVRVFCSFQQVLVLVDRNASIEDGSSDARQVLAETVEFVANLVSQLSCVAEHQAADTRSRLELLQSRQNKYCGLTHTGFGLADDVCAQDRLWDALVLNCGFEFVPIKICLILAVVCPR